MEARSRVPLFPPIVCGISHPQRAAFRSACSCPGFRDPSNMSSLSSRENSWGVKPRNHFTAAAAIGCSIWSPVAPELLALARQYGPRAIGPIVHLSRKIFPLLPFILSSLIVFLVSFRSAMAAAPLAPCLNALAATRAFPSADRGPVLFFEGRVRRMLSRSDLLFSRLFSALVGRAASAISTSVESLSGRVFPTIFFASG